MNSFQQVLLGLACVGGAFGLGHYLNNTPPLENEIVASSGSDFFRAPMGASMLEPAETAGVATLPNYRAPSKLNREFEPINLLPPPSQLAEPETASTSPAMLESQVVGLRQNQKNAAPEDGKDWDVEVPDFSVLRDKFNQIAMADGPSESSPAANRNPNFSLNQNLHSARKIELPQLTELTESEPREPEPKLKRVTKQPPAGLARVESGLKQEPSNPMAGENLTPSPHVMPSEFERRKIQVLDPTIDRYRLQLGQLSQAEDRTTLDRGSRNHLAPIGQATNLESESAGNIGSHADFNSEQFVPNLRSQPQSASSDQEGWSERTFSVLEPLVGNAKGPQADAQNQLNNSDRRIGMTSLRSEGAEFANPPVHLQPGSQHQASPREPDSTRNSAFQQQQQFVDYANSPRSNRVRSYSDPFPPLPNEIEKSASPKTRTETADGGGWPADKLPLKLNIPTDKLELDRFDARFDNEALIPASGEEFEAPPVPPQADPGFANWRQGAAVATYPAPQPGLTSLRQSNGNSMRSVQTSRFQSYVTQGGDSLAGISTRFFGKPDYYLDIYLVNQTLLSSPADVPVGVTLRIPVFD